MNTNFHNPPKLTLFRHVSDISKQEFTQGWNESVRRCQDCEQMFVTHLDSRWKRAGTRHWALFSFFLCCSSSKIRVILGHETTGSSGPAVDVSCVFLQESRCSSNHQIFLYWSLAQKGQPLTSAIYSAVLAERSLRLGVYLQASAHWPLTLHPLWSTTTEALKRSLKIEIQKICLPKN